MPSVATVLISEWCCVDIFIYSILYFLFFFCINTLSNPSFFYSILFKTNVSVSIKDWIYNFFSSFVLSGHPTYLISPSFSDVSTHCYSMCVLFFICIVNWKICCILTCMFHFFWYFGYSVYKMFCPDHSSNNFSVTIFFVHTK